MTTPKGFVWCHKCTKWHHPNFHHDNWQGRYPEQATLHDDPPADVGSNAPDFMLGVAAAELFAADDTPALDRVEPMFEPDPPDFGGGGDTSGGGAGADF